MKNFFKRFLIVILCFTMLSLVACKKGDNGSQDTEITLFKWDFASLNSARRQKTPIYNLLKEKAGGLELRSITSGYTDWEGTINNLYNTGNLPDVFIHYAVDRPQVFRKMVNDEVVINWKNYVTKAKYPNIYERLSEYDWLVDRVGYLKGGYWFLPITIKQTHAMFVRNDWVENLNAKLGDILVKEGVISKASDLTPELRSQYEFKVPENLIEFYRLAKAFTIYDPDNNGENDTYGYTCSGNLMWYNNWIFNAFDSTYWGWVENKEEKTVTTSWVTDENRKAVEFINRLYQEGIMDPDYTAMNDATKITNFCSGRTGIMVDNLYYNTYVEQLRAANNLTTEQAEHAIAVIAPPAGENGTFGTRGNAGFWCGVCINADVSDSKLTNILNLFEFMLSDEGYDVFTYGVEGANYKVENGEKISLMGQDANGYNLTAKSVDAAFDMHSFIDWSLSYNPGFSTNYELVNSYIERAEAYSRLESTTYVQTPLVITDWDVIGQSAYEYYVRLIGTNIRSYNYVRDKIGDVTWDDLDLDDCFESEWNTYLNKFKKDWNGDALIAEYAAEAKKYL